MERNIGVVIEVLSVMVSGEKLTNNVVTLKHQNFDVIVCVLVLSLYNDLTSLQIMLLPWNNESFVPCKLSSNLPLKMLSLRSIFGELLNIKLMLMKVEVQL